MAWAFQQVTVRSATIGSPLRVVAGEVIWLVFWPNDQSATVYCTPVPGIEAVLEFESID